MDHGCRHHPPLQLSPAMRGGQLNAPHLGSTNLGAKEGGRKKKGSFVLHHEYGAPIAPFCAAVIPYPSIHDPGQ
jgi:hypothetical protein